MTFRWLVATQLPNMEDLQVPADARDEEIARLLDKQMKDATKIDFVCVQLVSTAARSNI